MSTVTRPWVRPWFHPWLTMFTLHSWTNQSRAHARDGHESTSITATTWCDDGCTIEANFATRDEVTDSGAPRRRTGTADLGKGGRAAFK